MALVLAKENQVFVRKADNFVMGPGMDLGINDTVDNYEERECTEEELERFYKEQRFIKNKQS